LSNSHNTLGVRDRVSDVSYSGVNSNRQHSIIIESDPPGCGDRVVNYY